MRTMNSNHLIKVENLFVKIDRKVLIGSVNLNIHKGDFIILSGENGSGKTTLVEFITKQRYSRKVKYNGKIKFSYTPQITRFRGTVETIVYKYALSFGYLNNFERVISSFSLSNIRSNTFESISSGEKQRVLLAISMLSKPDIIVLDEFARGLDKNATAQFVKLINNLRVKYNDLAFIMISHNKEFAKTFKGIQYVIKNKKLVKGRKND